MFEVTATITTVALAAHTLLLAWRNRSAVCADDVAVTMDALCQRREYWRLPASVFWYRRGSGDAAQLAHDVVGGAVVFGYVEQAMGPGCAVQWLAAFLLIWLAPVLTVARWVHASPPWPLAQCGFRRAVAHWRGTGFSHVVTGFAALAARREASLRHASSLRLTAGTFLVFAPLASLLWCRVRCPRAGPAAVTVLAAVVGLALAPMPVPPLPGNGGGGAAATAAGGAGGQATLEQSSALAWVTPYVLAHTAAWLALAAVVSASATAAGGAGAAAAVPAAAATGDGDDGSLDSDSDDAAELVDSDDDSNHDDDDDGDGEEAKDTVPMLRRHRPHAPASTRLPPGGRAWGEGAEDGKSQTPAAVAARHRRRRQPSQRRQRHSMCGGCCVRWGGPALLASERVPDGALRRGLLWEGDVGREVVVVGVGAALPVPTRWTRRQRRLATAAGPLGAVVSAFGGGDGDGGGDGGAAARSPPPESAAAAAAAAAALRRHGVVRQRDAEAAPPWNPPV